MDSIREFGEKLLNNRLVVAIVVILVIILSVWYYHAYINNDYLHGMWVADADFCQEAGIDNLMIMIGDCNLFTNSSKMYVLMYNDEGILVNKSVDVTIGPTWNPWSRFTTHSVVIHEEMTFMPTNLIFKLSIRDGQLVIYGAEDDDVDTIFASLYKDHDSTQKAKLLD